MKKRLSIVLVFAFACFCWQWQNKVDSTPNITETAIKRVAKLTYKKQDAAIYHAQQTALLVDKSTSVKPKSSASNVSFVSDEAPPIARDKLEQNRYLGDLDDHQSYLEFEANTDKTLKQRYVLAAKQKAKLLEEYLRKGEQQGLSKEELVFAKEKIKALHTLALDLEKELGQN